MFRYNERKFRLEMCVEHFVCMEIRTLGRYIYMDFWVDSCGTIWRTENGPTRTKKVIDTHTSCGFLFMYIVRTRTTQIPAHCLKLFVCAYMYEGLRERRVCKRAQRFVASAKGVWHKDCRVPFAFSLWHGTRLMDHFLIVQSNIFNIKLKRILILGGARKGNIVCACAVMAAAYFMS